MNNTKETTIENVLAEMLGESTHLSPYQLIKVVNKITNRNLPTQMGYNYVRKGFISSVVIDGKKMIPSEEVVRWVGKYIEKNCK